MKYLFLACFLLLAGTSYLIHLSLPEAQSETPIIYWVTDANPARREQVKLFHQWLVSNARVREVKLESRDAAEAFVARASANANFADAVRQANPRGEQLFAERNNGEPFAAAIPDAEFPLTIKVPAAELRLDMANADRTKKIIQGVSGVAGDVQDQWSGGDMRYFRAIGLNADVTDAANSLGFGPDKTYPALETEITLENAAGERRQYQFPCNVNANLFFVNRGTFRQHGQELPPMRWTVEEFERRGRAFVETANRGLPRRTVFFADQIDPQVLRNSFGGSRFNETATRSAVDSPETRQAWGKIYQWTRKDRLVPDAADRASFTVESGYGGQAAQLFNSEEPARGQYAMMWTGRYMLIEFRKYDAVRKKQGRPLLDYGVSEPPHGGFPSTGIGTRAAMVFVGSKHVDLAEFFLAFLASAEYNMQIVRDGDALPPNPTYTKSDEYLRPAAYPNEWDVHGPFANSAMEIALGTAYSPFVLHATADRFEDDERDQYMNDLKSLDAVARDASAQIDAEIELTLREDPKLQPLYDQLLKQQEQIDALTPRLAELAARGEPIPEDAKIPLSLIENPFHRAYYAAKGWVK